jgi:penicillin-insensitive murein endopeptidase
MATGHASHQVGLDADIWFTPMPDRTLSDAERESMSARSLLKPGPEPRALDERLWTPAYEAVLRDAASNPQVERIFVAPAIKKKLCETVRDGKGWMGKIRPYWGHDDHFHVRIACQPGSPACKPQAPVGAGDGCDKSLDWWFTEEPWRPATGPQKPRPRDVMTMASLPKECRAVLNAPAPASAAEVTLTGPRLEGIAGAPAVRASAFAPAPASKVPLPTPRPTN